MSTEQKQKQSALQVIETQLRQAPNLRAAMSLSFVKDRYVANYEAITGRKDGKNKFQEDLFTLNDLAMENARIAECDRMSVFIALVKAGSTGLSLKSQGHLYLVPINKSLKCQIGAHGKREMMNRMPEIKFVYESNIVVQGDLFVVDKLANRITKHESTEKSVVNVTKIEEVLYAYTRIEYKDGRIVDVIVPQSDLIKARAASKNKGEDSVWLKWLLEMCKKVSLHRAFKLYFRYPEKSVLLPGMVEDEDEVTQDVSYKAAEDFVSIPVEEEAKVVVEEKKGKEDDFLS